MKYLSTYRNLRLAIAAMLVVTLVLVGMAIQTNRAAETHLSQINFSSRQRMLTQRLHRTLLQLAQPQAEPDLTRVHQMELEQTARQFNTVLQGFDSGYAGPDYLGDAVALPSLRDDPGAQDALQRSLSLWQGYFALLLDLGPTHAPGTRALGLALAYADQNSDELLELMDRLTTRLARNTRDELQRMMALQLAMGMLLLSFGGAALTMQHRIRVADRRQTAQLTAESTQIDEHLTEARRQLRDMLVVSPDLVWAKDELGVYKSCNKAYETFTGRPGKSLLGTAELDLYEVQQSQQERSRDSQLMGAGRSIHAEAQLTSVSDGYVGLYEIVRTPLCHPDGRDAGVQTVARDITLRREAETELRATHARLLLLETCISRVNDGMVITEVQPSAQSGRRIVFVNDAFVKVTGYTRPEIVGQTLQIMLGHKTDRHALETLDKAYASWQTGRAELLIYTKSGEELWVESEVTPIADGSNGDWYTHWVSVHRDITQRKQAQAEMQALYERATESSRLKSHFLSSISHEIRTPMNGVIGLTQLLLDTPLNAEQRKFTRMIGQAADALMAIINDILDFSKIESGKLRIEPHRFEIRPVLDACMALMAPIADQKQLLLRMSIDAAVPATLFSDDARLRQIVLNFLSNALKFTASGSVQLAVSALPTADALGRLRFEVGDTGIGIAPQEQPLLFQPFQQVDGSHTRKYGGTGLGLAISRQLVELMHGAIGVTSSPGEGSLFWFEIPLSTSQ